MEASLFLAMCKFYFICEILNKIFEFLFLNHQEDDNYIISSRDRCSGSFDIVNKKVSVNKFSDHSLTVVYFSLKKCLDASIIKNSATVKNILDQCF